MSRLPRSIVLLLLAGGLALLAGCGESDSTAPEEPPAVAEEPEPLAPEPAPPVEEPPATGAPAEPPATQEPEAVPEEEGSVAEPADSLGPFDVEDLAKMVLPLEELGPEARALGPDEDESGFIDSDEAADDTTDPEDVAADIEAAGWLGGYDLAATDFDALTGDEELVGAGTRVSLFEDAEAASAFLAKEVADLERLSGEVISFGLRLARVETFPIEGLGDEAVAIVGELTFEYAESGGFFVTSLIFRSDSLVASVDLGWDDQRDALGEVKRIARALDERIKAVLADEISEATVELPPEEEQPVEGEFAPPPGAPDLSLMTLSSDDLPEEFTVESEGYVDPEGSVSTYNRAFEAATVGSIGQSEVGLLSTRVDLFESEARASFFLGRVATSISAEGFAEGFARSFAEDANFEVEAIDSELVALEGVGDQAAGVRVTLDGPTGTIDIVQIFFRVDRTVNFILAVGGEGRVQTADLVVLAEAMVTRIQRGLLVTV